MATQPSTIRTAPNGRAWTLANGLVEREVRFEPGKGLATTSWRSLVTGTDFMEPAREGRGRGAEFSFTADGREFRGAGDSFDFLGAEIKAIEPSGKVLRVSLQARAQKLRVRVHYAVYDGHPVIRKWIEIRNLADAPVTLTHLIFEETEPVAGGAGRSAALGVLRCPAARTFHHRPGGRRGDLGTQCQDGRRPLPDE